MSEYYEKMDLNQRAFNKSVEVYDRDDLFSDEVEIINKYFRGKKVLDLGCGVGRTTVNLYRQGYNVIGIDYSYNSIKRAREKYPKIDFRFMDASDLKFKNNSFDIVFFSYNGLDCLIPYKKRIRCLREARRVLKYGGLMIYSSHKRFYFGLPFRFKWPFINTCYIRNMFLGLFAFNNYRHERFCFGLLKTYCKNYSGRDAKKAGFRRVKRIPKSYFSYYICQK